MPLTQGELTEIYPKCKDPTAWLNPLNVAMARYEIDTPNRIASFLAQIGVESGQLNRLDEDLNYTAKRLTEVWKNRFPTIEEAEPFAGNPKKLANKVYASRLGNGDAASGDGWTFRGRGLMQVTGRGNYREVGKAIDLPLEDQPDQLMQPAAAAMSAAYFWSTRGCNPLADDTNVDDDEEDFISITILINGRKNGLKDRRTLWGIAKATLGV